LLEGQETVFRHVRCEQHRRLNVFGLQVEILHARFKRIPFREAGEDHAHHDPSALDARFAVAHVRLDADPVLPLLFLKPDEDREAFMSAMGVMYRLNCDRPKVDREFVETVKIVKRMARGFNEEGEDW
jgi:hypothetical protein